MENILKASQSSEKPDDSKPLLLDDNSLHMNTPSCYDRNIVENNLSRNDDNDMKRKPSQIKEVQVTGSSDQVDRFKGCSKKSKIDRKSILIRKATLWRRKSKQNLQMKNEDRERKATETLAIVLGNLYLHLYRTHITSDVYAFF